MTYSKSRKKITSNSDWSILPSEHKELASFSVPCGMNSRPSQHVPPHFAALMHHSGSGMTPSSGTKQPKSFNVPCDTSWRSLCYTLPRCVAPVHTQDMVGSCPVNLRGYETVQSELKTCTVHSTLLFSTGVPLRNWYRPTLRPQGSGKPSFPVWGDSKAGKVYFM